MNFTDSIAANLRERNRCLLTDGRGQTSAKLGEEIGSDDLKSLCQTLRDNEDIRKFACMAFLLCTARRQRFVAVNVKIVKSV
jgi:hypothetical protein